MERIRFLVLVMLLWPVVSTINTAELIAKRDDSDDLWDTSTDFNFPEVIEIIENIESRPRLACVTSGIFSRKSENFARPPMC